MSKTKAISKTIMIITVMILVVAGALAGLFLVSGSGSSAGSNISCSSSAYTSGVQISIVNGASNSANPPGYSPDKIILVVGSNNTVTWTNNDGVHHTVTSSSSPVGASFNSGNMDPGAVYSCTFSAPGTYQYYCEYHSWMAGTIVVET